MCHQPAHRAGGDNSDEGDDTVVWGNDDTVVWGNDDTVVWGNNDDDDDTVVWGNSLP